MANLVETSRWEAGIYQFETSDPVMGGPNGIDNRPTRELANRTLWLKNELAAAVASIGANKTSAENAIVLKADKTTNIIAGNGLTGGGDLSAAITVALGTPGTITATSNNAVTSTSHTHAIDKASTTAAGIVQLSAATNSTAVNLAATPSAVKAAYDLAAAAAPSGAVAFFAGQAAPDGWLKANGAAVSRTVYAALFAAIGTRYGAGDGSTTFNLPDLRGLFLRALDEGKGIDVGRVLGSHQTDAMQRWFAEFTYQRAQINGVETVNGGIQFVSTAYGTPQPASNGWAVARAIIGPDVNNSARVAGETRPTNMALLACIKI